MTSLIIILVRYLVESTQFLILLEFLCPQYIPIIESETQKSRIEYTTTTLSDDLTKILLKKASDIFNKEYTAYNNHESRKGKTYIGVESNGTRYSALSMSAGEQKVFLLLETIFKADKYSLILIDEIDLLLHNLALNKLLKIVAERASKKNLQIMFTTHRESIVELSELINIRHIVTKSEKTYCFNETKPDAIHRLTGKQEKTIEIFVEDDLATAILDKKEISWEQDSHNYLSRIIERLDYDKSVGYTKIIDLVSTHCQDQWQCYISEVYTWLEEKVTEVRE